MNKTLSILIISLPERIDSLKKLYQQLQVQSANKPEVEILTLTDNRSMSVGKKRQYLNMLANGEYVVHVDDDDDIHPDFISTLLSSIDQNPGVDVISYIVQVSIDGSPPKPCVYSYKFHQNINFDDHYQRLPNTRCCFRRAVALREEIPDMVFGEDDEWAKKIQNHIHSEYCIKVPMYYYNASTQKPVEWFETL